MLIQFTVENHRAIRERQTFSMVAEGASSKTREEVVVETGISVAPTVLRTACLFGANGSGKSSLIEAMEFMSRFVRDSFRRDAGKGIPTEPFLYHSEWREKPSEFEVVFVHRDTLYQYGFAVDRERVHDEWLFARPKSTGRERTLFTRSFNKEADTYEWSINGVYLKGERESWRAQTRPDALFLSTAVQLNADDLRDPFDWIVSGLRSFSMSPDTIHNQYTASKFTEETWKARVIEFLRQADIRLSDIQVEEEDFEQSSAFKSIPEPLQEAFRVSAPGMKTYNVSFVRKDEKSDDIPLAIREESSGTKALFALAGPLIDVLENGLTVVIDELNAGLHPLAFQHIIGFFCDPSVNRNNAQLIFTTHDTSVTHLECIGRDQIWLIEKGDDLAARLTPYSDFKTRDARSFQRAYLQGRYGAVPRILD
ncbi:MAG: RloA protein [Rhodobacteraceae bacterium]|nr:MAG: RloA protein [Paracoccaceae bacterium]